MWFMRLFCFVVARDALAARNVRFELARTYVGARKIKRAHNFDVATHGSYDQPAIFVFPQI